MQKLTIYFDKKREIFKVNLNKSQILFNLRMLSIKTNTMATPSYNFMLILRVLSRCGLVKPLKKF